MELKTFRMASPRSRTVWSDDRAVKTKPDEAIARGPESLGQSLDDVLYHVFRLTKYEDDQSSFRPGGIQ